ncbi:MAG: histidinol dehydrogenase [Planctomycetes bacterium]|nr:histidinol dehydrogenase [Planctomycetota bacterium]
MANELDKILIKEGQKGFPWKLGQLRGELMRDAVFGPTDKEIGQVNEIIANVHERGDEAVAEFTEKFDGVKLTPEQFRISEAELNNAHKAIDKKLLKSIRQAIKNVKEYQSKIFIGKDKNFKTTGIRYTPIKRVGICVPGASAPLLSTVIMTAVPALVAGVKEIVIVSPPRYNGSIHPVILAVCQELQNQYTKKSRKIEVYRIGGAQAVAALSLGTENITHVSKIVGPGNKWVQTAKQCLSGFGFVGIDSAAGPSEVLIIANDKAKPVWVAADMLSQAEHDPGSAILLTDSLKLAKQVLKELKRQIEDLGRAEKTKECLLKYSKIAVFDHMDDVIDCANSFASEHLEIQCGEESEAITKKIENAGAIFIGDYSPVAVGDYWAGPSHTLPTGRTARFSSALTSNDFVKSISIIEYDKKKLAASADDIIRLAEAEGLDAHARSVRIRQQK